MEYYSTCTPTLVCSECNTRGSDVVLIGELELEFPDAGRSRRHREVEIQFDFSHTEIQVRTKWHERQTLAVPSTQVH